MEKPRIEKAGKKHWKVVGAGELEKLFNTKKQADSFVAEWEKEHLQVTEEPTSTEPTTTEQAPEAPHPEAPQSEVSGSQAEPDVQPPKVKKLSTSDFVMFHLCEHPEATEEELRQALDQAGLKMSESVLKTWPGFMAKIFNKLTELGWKRPATN